MPTADAFALVGTPGDGVKSQGFAVLIESADALAPRQTCWCRTRDEPIGFLQ